MHNKSVETRLDNVINKINEGDDLSCLLLIDKIENNNIHKL